jgi:phosphoribosyl-AMP cyclohydrolase
MTDNSQEREEKKQAYINAILEKIAWDENGLLTTVVQDAETGLVLMVAWMNADALRLTLDKGETHFWSRSRQELWHKGETSGNTQRVVGMFIDCDADTLLLKVIPAGPACHTNADTCFYRPLEELLD